MVHDIHTDQEFLDKENDIINSKKSAVVLFHADWCTSCKSKESLIENESYNHEDCEWIKVNVANTPQVTKKYNVKGLPTLLTFKNGKLYDKICSSFTQNDLFNQLDAIRS